jgi:hypothetical protein
MKEVLGELNRIKGVMGSLIAAPDGMIIASDLAVQTPDEVLGAMAASVGATVAKALDRMQQGKFIQAMMDAANGKIFLADAGIGYLVVVTDKDVNVGLVRVEMRAAADKLRRR